MASFGEAFASGLNAGSSTIYRGMAAGKLADERRADRDIADVAETSRAAYLDKIKAIEADTSMSDHDRMQAINAARGERFDALQSVYEKHNRGADFNNLITADVARRNNLTNQALQDRRDNAATRQEDAAFAEDTHNFKTLVQAARDGDKKAQAKFNLIAAINGMQASISDDGTFMVAPLAGGEAIPMNMTQAFDAWRGFKPIEQQIQALYGNEALRTGDATKLDNHNKSESSLKNDAVTRRMNTATAHGKEIQNAIKTTDQFHYDDTTGASWKEDWKTKERKDVQANGKAIRPGDVKDPTRSEMAIAPMVERVQGFVNSLPKKQAAELGDPQVVWQGNKQMIAYTKSDGTVETVPAEVYMQQAELALKRSKESLAAATRLTPEELERRNAAAQMHIGAINTNFGHRYGKYEG